MLTWENSPTVYNSALRELVIRGVNAPAIFKDSSDQPDGLLIERCQIKGNSSTAGNAPGMRILGGMSGVTARQSEFWGDSYGIDCDIPPGYGSGLDWWTFEDCIIGGKKTAIRFRTSNAGGGGWAFRRTRFGGGSESTIIIKGNAPGWVWERCAAAEAQGGGTWGVTQTWTGLATASAGSDQVTINDATALVTGDLLTIKNAGSNRIPHETTITGKNGNVVTVTPPVVSAVTGQPCTNARHDIIKVPSDAAEPGYVGAPTGHLFLNTGFGRGSGSNIRYSVGGGAQHVFVGFNSFNAPVLDAYNRSVIINSPGLEVWSNSVRFGASEIREGEMRWDYVNKRPIWSNGTAWVDATGAVIP